MNEGPEIDRSRLNPRASRLRIFRWVPLVIAILIMIAFAVLLVIGRESSRPVGQLPGTPRRSPQSRFNSVDPPLNRNPNRPRLLHAHYNFR